MRFCPKLYLEVYVKHLYCCPCCLSTTIACTWCQLDAFSKYNLTQNKWIFSEPAIEPQAIALKSGGCTAPPGAHLPNLAFFLFIDDLSMLPPTTLDNHSAIVCY